ncbi:MAG: 4-hydroxybenzoate decarboxylase, partial [Candidatus Electrothrix sp. AX2]|nr:4-hydroxybenzoate decarboxylase [Candidatus Electrothrix gigas]
MTSVYNLRQYLDILRQEDELLVIDSEVDPYLEIAEIHRRIIASNGPALLFTKVKGSSFPVVTNLFGTNRRLELAFGARPTNFVTDLVRLAEQAMPPSLSTLQQAAPLALQALKIGMKNVRPGVAPILETLQKPARMSELPMLTSWHSDGGAFVTLPLVYTEHPDGHGHNLGMYRIH